MDITRINPDACIACTSCTVSCPVAAANPDFPGPRLIGPAYERFRLLDLREEDALSYCANCKNCEITCPQNVPVGTINMVARAAQLEKSNPHFLRDWIVSHSETLGRLMERVPARFKNSGISNSLVRRALDGIGIHRDAPLPEYSDRRFRTKLGKMSQSVHMKKVAYFPGCYVDLYDSRTGEDFVWLMNRAGFEVVSDSGLRCCGVPMVASGFLSDARKNAERNLAIIRKYLEQGIPVLTTCPSCELMFREEIPMLFPELAAKYEGVCLSDAQEFLLDMAGEGRLSLKIADASAKNILYHAPCHMRALGIGLPGLELMRALGISVTELGAGCCGISGSYGFKKEKHDTAMKVGAEVFARVKEADADLVATECGTCRLQIGSATGAKTWHPVSVIRSLCID